MQPNYDGYGAGVYDGDDSAAACVNKGWPKLIHTCTEKFEGAAVEKQKVAEDRQMRGRLSRFVLPLLWMGGI